MFRKIHILLAFLCVEYSSGFLINITDWKEKGGNHFRNGHVARNRSWFIDDHIPDHLDYREIGAVSPVKDQGVCAACWAFGITANIESQMRLKFGNELVLSEQFLIDCLKTSGGCSVGTVVSSLAEIVSSIGGVLKADDYCPYDQQKHECRWETSKKLVPVIGFRRVYHKAQEIIKHLLREGPLIAGINSRSMDSYRAGTIDEPSDEECDPNDLNHVVLIVGYSAYVNEKTNTTVPYWIIKNSWGIDFGDNGFYYLVRGRNACGIESDVSYVNVK